MTQEFALVRPIKLQSDHRTLWKRAILHKSGKELLRLAQRRLNWLERIQALGQFV